MTTRRGFMQGSISVAAAIATGAAADAAPSQAPVAIASEQAVIQPASPYKNYPWRWFCSNDGEVYHEDCDTVEQALAQAKSGDYSFVAKCKQQDFDLSVDSDSIMELLYNSNEERIGEGEFIDASKEQLEDLEKMVTGTIEQWVVKHKINITAWTFAQVQDEKRVRDIEEATAYSDLGEDRDGVPTNC